MITLPLVRARHPPLHEPPSLPRHHPLHLAHHGQARLVVIRAAVRISVSRSARRPALSITVLAIDLGELALILGIVEHVLGRVLEPAVDEIAVHAERRAGRELKRGRAAPSVGQDLAQVVADREAQARDAVPALGAVVLGLERARAVRAVERRRLDAVVEAEDGLQVRRAGRRREGGCFLVGGRGVAFAEPGEPDVFVVQLGLGGGEGVAGDDGEVLRDGRVGVEDVFVVGGEAHGLDLGAGRAVDVVEGGDPCREVSMFDCRICLEMWECLQ